MRVFKSPTESVEVTAPGAVMTAAQKAAVARVVRARVALVRVQPRRPEALVDELDSSFRALCAVADPVYA